MKTAAVFVIGLVIAIIVLQVIKATEYRRYAWLYVAILLLGMAAHNRAGLIAFGNDLQNKLKGG